MKKLCLFGLPLVMMALVLMACPDAAEDDGNDISINWESESGGTLSIANNTQKDMVLFLGQPSDASNLIGGVRAGAAKNFDISDDLDDFDAGGLLILRGMSRDEYEANSAGLSRAKIEYSAYAVYGPRKTWHREINPDYTGDFGYKVSNLGPYGLELRKDGPNGEAIAYLPALTNNYQLYAKTSTELTLCPVYVYYSRSTGNIRTLKPASVSEMITIVPRPDDTSNTFWFPPDGLTDFESRFQPSACITVTNQVPNQAVRFTLEGNKVLSSQEGYDVIGTDEQLTFELESTKTGEKQNIVITLFAGSLHIPVRFIGETDDPIIKNGYDYAVSINYKGSGELSDPASYAAIIIEGARQDIADEFVSP
ncbi:MAG: hypothetical protein LBT95_02360 [Treponema sp.]|jgi:hypothetical protein|nr:hypothetical protein [Treponema sp.]